MVASSINGVPRATPQSNRNPLTPADITKCLRGSLPNEDPCLPETDRLSAYWPDALKRRFGGPLIPAAVLMPVINRSGGATLLLTRRSIRLRHHAGQVSFPGGSMEADDASVAETALRETWEEVGIEADRISVSGYLPAMPTITGFVVTPVVGVIEQEPRLTLDAREVHDAFEVPLAHVMEPANEIWSERMIEGVSVPLAEFHYGGQRIWGATAAMIIALREELAARA